MIVFNSNELARQNVLKRKTPHFFLFWMALVRLIAKTNQPPVNLISHAAKTCYTAKVPKMGKTLDVENSLFNTGHHTTLQHNYFTFNISELSVSATLFGLHLTHPFYNTDQRSGRFSKMYTKPNAEKLSKYMSKYFPNQNLEPVLKFINKGFSIYKNNIDSATELVANFIKEERPFANDKYIQTQAPKIAQEQMRMFISTINPTALDYTVNLSTLTAMYRSAWTPEMRDIVNQMENLVLKSFPDLSYMFNKATVRKDNWVPRMHFKQVGVKTSPICHVLGVNLGNVPIHLNTKMPDSVDLKYFTPESMNNNVSTIDTRVELSLATMGQDQRHRTIKRSEPELTGNFYLPPVCHALGLQNDAIDYMKEYANLARTHDKNLVLSVAPYGVMSTYVKHSDLNALIHEQEKRLCWSAQEEIYHLSKQLHDYLADNGHKDLAAKLTPACYRKACIEGSRYCGRDTKKSKNSSIIPQRRI